MNLDQELLSRFSQLSLQDKNKLINGINKDAVEIIKKMFPDSQTLQNLLELKKQFSK
jgi:hypothetical protein